VNIRGTGYQVVKNRGQKFTRLWRDKRRKTDDRGQRTEDGGQGTEVYPPLAGQMTEDGGQRTEDGGQGTEDRSLPASGGTDDRNKSVSE